MRFAFTMCYQAAIPRRPILERPVSTRSAIAKTVFVIATAALLAGCETDGAPGPVARSTGEQRQAAIDSLTHEVPPQSLEMASGQCWMDQEKKKNVNNIDAKIAAVDECIAEKKKKYPNLM
jgi:hypothetical protein